MTRVDFYLLSNPEPNDKIDLVAKLAEKASGGGQKVYIFGSSSDELKALDDHLWSFRPLSFVAHQLLTEDEQRSNLNNDPVLLGAGEPGNDRQILINLHSQVPVFFSRFQRTLEIVSAIPEEQEAGRERYRFYQSRGYPLKHHKL